ncbi:MAG: hypothetical protein AAGE01_07800 [Pseudomonadota bacterium]
MPNYVQHLAYGGVNYVLLECANLRDEAVVLRVVKHCEEELSGHPTSSLRLLFNLENTIFTRKTLAAVAEFNAAIGRSLIRSAILGAEGMMTIAVNNIARESQRPVQMFKDHAAAVEWLIGDD